MLQIRDTDARAKFYSKVYLSVTFCGTFNIHNKQPRTVFKNMTLDNLLSVLVLDNNYWKSGHSNDFAKHQALTFFLSIPICIFLYLLSNSVDSFDFQQSFIFHVSLKVNRKKGNWFCYYKKNDQISKQIMCYFSQTICFQVFYST